jgi:type II restriction enzyme
MKLQFNTSLASLYNSPTQKIRVMTESWVDNNIFCPNCGEPSVTEYPNNAPVADFYCSSCSEDYELKSKKNKLGAKVVDGAFTTMIERLQSASNPNFFLMTYDVNTLNVKDFLVIPKHFFVSEIIEKRKPLAITARRAGWVGCNINLKGVPETGKIFYVKQGLVKPKKEVIESWQKTLFLRESMQMASKGWLLDIIRCIEATGKVEFTLNDIYSFEAELKRLHPENKHIKDKIRQQLQILRDKGFLEFKQRGLYKLV